MTHLLIIVMVCKSCMIVTIIYYRLSSNYRTALVEALALAIDFNSIFVLIKNILEILIIFCGAWLIRTNMTAATCI